MFSKSGGMLLLLLCFSPIADAYGAGPDWTSGTYAPQSFGMELIPIGELFKEFSKVQGVPIILDDKIEQEVSVVYPPSSPVEYLNNLTRDFGLIWYFDGAAIHVSPASELQAEILQMGAIDVSAVVTSLKHLGIFSDRFPITVDEEYGLIQVIGPPRYREVIKTVIDGANLRAVQNAQIQVDIQVFPLRYAWATDQSFVIGDNQVQIPGVATLLQNLAGISSGPSTSASLVSQLPNNLQSLRGFGLIRPQNQALANAQQAAFNAELAARQAETRAQVVSSIQQNAEGTGPRQQREQELASQVQPFIEADSRTNSIIIRDLAQRMETYRKIINELDQPSGLVEIKATIVDLDADTGFQLGLPYEAIWNNNGSQRSVQASISPDTATNALLNPGNLTFTLMDDQVTQFFLNMQALESEGHARLVSKPSIVTINNIEAFLQEIEEIYVRVPGFEQNDLFNISVGTRLFVVPHIIHEPEGRRVKLNVRLEDGSPSTTSQVEDIPFVSRNTINTQAVLLEGQSLLLGGLVREEESETIQGVPVLSRLPKIGAVFRETVHTTRRFERMVLLTPRIIDLPGSADCQPRNPNPISPQLPSLNELPMQMAPIPDSQPISSSFTTSTNPEQRSGGIDVNERSLSEQSKIGILEESRTQSQIKARSVLGSTRQKPVGPSHRGQPGRTLDRIETIPSTPRSIQQTGHSTEFSGNRGSTVDPMSLMSHDHREPTPSRSEKSSVFGKVFEQFRKDGPDKIKK